MKAGNDAEREAGKAKEASHHLGGLVIREAGPDEAPLIHRLTQAAYEEYRGVLLPEVGVFREGVAEVQAAIERGGAVVALIGGQPAGCARWALHGSHSTTQGPTGTAEPCRGGLYPYVYVGRVAVLPAFRRRGVATALMAWLEDRARQLGAREIRLGVRTGLPRNRALYERLGYVACGDEKREGYGPIATWMRKRLD